MQILSINTGKAQPIDNKTGFTAIFKKPRTEAVSIGELGLEGDEICDLKNHGGPDQAVYLYGQPDYAFWEKELGRELAPGLFGENLTITGLESQKSLVGDRFRIGEVLLEVTSPRIPCSTFAMIMDDKTWVKRFHAAERPGIYTRVLETGTVTAGDEIEFIPYQGEPIPAIAMMTDYKNPAPERMRWFLQAPVHRDMRRDFEAKLAELGG